MPFNTPGMYRGYVGADGKAVVGFTRISLAYSASRLFLRGRARERVEVDRRRVK